MERSAIEEWQKANTFLCPHGLGRISPETCKALRNRPDSCSWTVGSCLPRPKQCEKCREYKALCKVVEIKRKNSKESVYKMKKKIICPECKEEGFLHGRGLCSKCYFRLKKEGNLDKYPPLQTKILTYKKTGKENSAKETIDTRRNAVVMIDKQTEHGSSALPQENEIVQNEPVPPPPAGNKGEPIQGQKGKEDADNDRIVTLNFNNFPEIYSKVTARADDQFRTLELQIMYELSRIQ